MTLRYPKVDAQRRKRKIGQLQRGKNLESRKERTKKKARDRKPVCGKTWNNLGQQFRMVTVEDKEAGPRESGLG